MDPKFTNTDLNPTQVIDSPFLYCCDDQIYSKYSTVKSWGKWLMFFKKDILDEKWAAACELYRQEKFTGIAWMKVSTAQESDRANDKNSGVINFYCGPVNDEAAVKQYGKNLLSHFPYQTNFEYMFFKSDQQTMRGTRATGRKTNSIYRIAVPRENDEDDYYDHWPRGKRHWSPESEDVSDVEKKEEPISPPTYAEFDPNYTNKDFKPSEVTDYPFLYRCNDQVRAQSSNITAWGKWLMFFKKEHLDEKWAEACEIFDSGRLISIPWMKVSTANENNRGSDKTMGVIAFYCGPSNNRKLMLELGKMILNHFPYGNKCGYMYYKSEAQTAMGTRATGRWKNSLYKIAVPRNDEDYAYCVFRGGKAGNDADAGSGSGNADSADGNSSPCMKEGITIG